MSTVKKASDLKSLKDLKLYPWSYYRISGKNYTNEQLVKAARANYYRHGGRIRGSSGKWLDVLTLALDRAGYIRHDIVPETFAVGGLYKRINKLSGQEDICIYSSYDELNTNEKYENCQCFSMEEYHKLRKLLKDSLSFEEFFALTRYYGLYGEKWSYGSIAKARKTSSCSIRQTVKRAQQKVATNGLPPLVHPSY